MLTGETEELGKNGPSTILSTGNLSRTELGLRSERPAPNRLSYSNALV
jgi:hypothetical protein